MEYKKGQVLKGGVVWKDLYIYRKSDALYQLTVVFCRRFLPPYGDRTVDQMIQAARSGKQNIVEGSEDGKTSTEMELKLLNVARASLQELCEDYKDYLKSHNLPLWNSSNDRYERMRLFCREHNDYDAYSQIAETMSDEEMANLALTLCHQTDKMMVKYLEQLEKQFVTEGGIKERMHAARTGYRNGMDNRLHELEAENQQLKEEVAKLKEEIRRLRNT